MPEKVRRSRHDPDFVIDRKLLVHEPLIELLDLFDPSDRYDILPRNWVDAFAPINPKTGRPRNPEYFRHYLGELTCKRTTKPHSLLARYTMNGEENNNEMMKYYRTKAGDDLMAEHGRPKMAYHRPKTADKHQLFGNLCRASLELGVRTDPNFYLRGPRHILNHEKMGSYDAEHPFVFHLPDGRRYSPDDKPLVIGRYDTRESKLLLSEDDRGTEGTSPAKSNDDQTRLDEKFEKIIAVWKHRLFEKKYGHRSALLLFKTIGDRRAENVRAYLAERFGPLPYVLIKGFPEFAKLYRTIPVTTKAWDTPWIRPGCGGFSLKTLGEA